MDTHLNKGFKGAMREKWEQWLEHGEKEYTEGGKRKRVLYEMLGKWVQEIWCNITGNSIVNGFRQNGYIDFTGDIDILHSRLKETA